MNIKDLIEQLSRFNPETEVLGMCTDPTNYTYKVPIQSIEWNNPYDSNGYSGVDGSEMDDEESYIVRKVVLLNLGDV
jgi:hypothetical protein